MVKRLKINGRMLYICEECGLGYVDEQTAQKCEEWCAAHKSCSLAITKNAVYRGDLTEQS